MREVFYRHWWLLARAEQLTDAGDYVAKTLGHWPVLVRRDERGELRGFHNVCRHRAGPLVHEGAGNCKGFVCRYHGWRYDGEGCLINASGLQQTASFDYADYSLFTVRVDCWNGLVFVCLDESAPTLVDWLGDIDRIAEAFPRNADMRWHGEVEKSGPVNWKTYGDNSCEGYHVGMVHTVLGRTVSRDKVDIQPYENGQFVGFDVEYKATDVDKTRAGRGFWIYKFPALLMHFSEFSFNVEQLEPLSTNQTRMARWFWIDDEKAAARGVTGEDLLASSEQVMGEDLDICVSVQRNLAAGVYKRGRLSSDKEPGTIYFQKLIRAALDGSEKSV